VMDMTWCGASSRWWWVNKTALQRLQRYRPCERGETVNIVDADSLEIIVTSESAKDDCWFNKDDLATK